MSQKMRILSVRVEGTPFTGCDRWGGPVYESDPDKVMEWLCNGWRYRFNRVRSRRMKYADPDHALLEPIGDTTDTRLKSEAKNDTPWLAAMPDRVIATCERMENTEWWAAVQRRKTIQKQGGNPGSMPRWKRRKQGMTFDCWYDRGNGAVYRKTNRKHGIVTIGGIIPAKYRNPGIPARYRIIIRVRVSQPIREYTSIHVNWTRREIVFVSQPQPLRHEPTGCMVGLDGGAVHELTDSNGVFHDLPLDELKRIDRKVRSLQKAQARCRKPARYPNVKDYLEHGASNRYQRLDKEISRLKAHATRIIEDAQHKMTTRLVQDNDIIVVEDLQVRNMTRTPQPKPDPLHPGHYLSNGRTAKRGLNRVMRRAALGRVYRMLEYKANLAGVTLIHVNPAYTSQTCSRCGYAAKENRENQAVFHCGECGLTMNADANAATNILSKGLRETEPYNPSDWGTGHVPGRGASDVHTAMSRMNAVPDEAETTMRKETPEHGIPAL